MNLWWRGGSLAGGAAIRLPLERVGTGYRSLHRRILGRTLNVAVGVRWGTESPEGKDAPRRVSRPVSFQVSASGMPRTPIRVLLCDGVAVRRALIRDFLEEDGEIVVGEIVGAIESAPRARRVEPDVVITTASELEIGGAVLPADVRWVAPGAAVFVLCDRDERRVVAEGVVELPRSISLAHLRREVIAAAVKPSAGRAKVPLLNRPGRRA
jgi:hypothetical protein